MIDTAVELHEHISSMQMHQLAIFGLSALGGCLFAYYRIWAEGRYPIPLHVYLFGDPHALGRALTTLVAMVAGAGGLDFLSAMTDVQIVTAGIAIGLVTPDRSKLR